MARRDADRFEGGEIDQPLFAVWRYPDVVGAMLRGDDVIEVALAVDADAEPILRLRDDRLFSLTLDDMAMLLRQAPRDMPVYDALARLWRSEARVKFYHRQAPRALAEEGHFDISEADRERLRKITRKHASFYFAGEPTNAQVDQLIDSLGPKVAARLVKKAVDTGEIE